MTYNLKIKNQKTQKETIYTIEDLKQMKIILENYKDELVEVELHKVLRKENTNEENRHYKQNCKK